jgi:integrase
MDTIHDFSGRLKRAKQLLEKSDISDTNKDLIHRFIEFKTAGKVKLARLGKYYSILRLLAERHLEGRDFTALTKEDVISIVADIERSSFSDWSKWDYSLIIKIFYQWLGKDELVSWIKVKTPAGKTVPEDLATEADVHAMIDAANYTRDKALIACLYEGGFRIGELGGLTIGAVTFDRYGAMVIVSGKTGMRRVRLIFAMPYLAHWLESHPSREKKDAPLWINLGAGSRTQGMQYQALRLQILRIAERAGVGCKVNPHNFRHSRATHLASHLTESQLNEYLGLVQGSKMTSVYVHLSGRDLDKDLLRLYGLESGDKPEAQLKSVQCPHCRALNTTSARVCVNCRMPLTVEEAMDKEERVMQFFSDMMELAAKSPEVAGVINKYVEKDVSGPEDR